MSQKRIRLTLEQLTQWVTAYGECQYCHRSEWNKKDECLTCGAIRAQIEDFGVEVNDERA